MTPRDRLRAQLYLAVEESWVRQFVRGEKPPPLPEKTVEKIEWAHRVMDECDEVGK